MPTFERPQAQLAFRPRWWWDPVPEWFLHHLDDSIVAQLGKVQLELQAQVLEQQLAATRKVQEIVGKQR